MYLAVSASEDLDELPPEGRLLVILDRVDPPEEGSAPGVTGRDEAVFAVDVRGWSPGETVILGSQALGFPYEVLEDLPVGRYHARPLYDVDTMSSGVEVPGNLTGPAVTIEVDAYRGIEAVRLVVDRRIPIAPAPAPTEWVQTVEVESRLLSEFWGRPVVLRAAVVLPRGYVDDPGRSYPTRYHAGPYGARSVEAFRLMGEGSLFREEWLAEGTPRMVLVHLDGEAPFGDPYQVDSENNGPWAEATVTELIPAIEERFRVIREPWARFLDGEGAGGWAALALQVFFPEQFNGAWSFCPDSLDFRALQLIDIYDHDNAFVNPYGYDRPSMRDPSGEPRFTVATEVWREQVLGRGDTFVTSGGQWGGLNAAFSPRGEDNLPRALFDPETGDIDDDVAESWRSYDLRYVLQEGWAELGPQLVGKLHIWASGADSYFNEGAVLLMADFLLGDIDPPSDATIEIGPGQPTCWKPMSESEIMAQMLRRIEGR